MLRILALCLTICIFQVRSQSMDLSFCDPNKLPVVTPEVPFFTPSIVGQYEMNLEINEGLRKRTFEMDEFFDGLLNRAVTITRFGGIETRIYNYDASNELITVSGDLCIVSKINETDSIVQSIVLNGTEHIISGLLFLQLQNPNSKVAYIGTSVVRGIPVNQWQFCAYEPRSMVTSKFTFSVSDPKQWTIAIPVGNLTAVPVEIQTDNKYPNGTTWTDLIEVTKFRPGILTRDEFWVTPRGVFCPGRSKGKALPDVPQIFKFHSTVVAPLPGFDELIGDIQNIREEYDYKNKLVRLDYVVKNNPLLEIHDYNTGIRYTIDKFRGNCSLSVIDPSTSIDAEFDGTTIKLKDPMAFFDFENVEYQYVGQRHSHNVNCDVWIGKTTMFNLTVTKEWYFMADGWVQQSNLAVEVREPVKLTITFYRPFKNNITNQIDYQKVPVHYYINDFDESGLNLWDFDLAACVDNYPKRHFMFNLPSQYLKEMESNKAILWLGILLGIETSVAVPRLRISRLQVDFNEDFKEIVVIFTLLEKAPQIGWANATVELSLEDASRLLEATINAGKLLIPFPISDDTAVDIQAIPGSLLEFERGKGNIAYMAREKLTGYSGGSVAGIAIGLLIVGLVIGLIAGVFFCIYKPNLIPLDRLKNFSPLDTVTGFKNQGYESKSSA